jgi:cell division septation protein DedD
MITIKPSSTTDNGDTTPVEDSDSEHKKRIPLVWIPATLVVGLLIAAIYLGGRIVKAHGHAKPETVHLATPIPIPAVKPESVTPQSNDLPPSAPPQTTEKIEPPAVPTKASTKEFVGPEPLTLVQPGDGIPMITPRSGELYIQVGALDSEATRRFVQRLRSEGMQPHVAPGPKPELMRVLIGPFDDRNTLNEKKAQLESEGIDTFVRQY